MTLLPIKFRQCHSLCQDHFSKSLGVVMVINKVDVICEHKSDGSIIPLRFQILDEDGAYQRFTIKGYKLNEVDGAYTIKDCLYVSRGTNIYECKIDVLGYKKFVRLYYFVDRSQWKLGFD